MNKRYLPAIASLFIIAMLAATIVPVYAAAALRAVALPTLVVKTIPEDDEVRKTGVILLGMTTPEFNFAVLFPDEYHGLIGIIEYPSFLLQPGWPEPNTPTYPDFLAQFKLLVSFNGVPVTPDIVTCQVIEKDKANPLKDKQFPAENLKTVPKDQSQNFVCKPRWAKPGVGVLDVYYIGPISGQYISDYVLVVSASYTIGRTIVSGAEIQDICVLGWPSTLVQEVGFVFKPVPITKPDGTVHWVYADALGTVASCEDMSLLEKYALGLTIPWT